MVNEGFSSKNLYGRKFLLLQGPQSGFFRKLSQELEANGAKVYKVNFCGGDVVHWGFKKSYWYLGSLYKWPEWIGGMMDEKGINDILLYGDWRPYHWEAVRLAKFKKIRVWVFEEGYLREGFSTLEIDGVNGRSKLPKDPTEILKRASSTADLPEPVLHNDMRHKVSNAVLHHVGNFFLFPVFFRYRTHRPTNILRELVGLIPRLLSSRKRQQESERLCEKFYAKFPNFYFFPLQLNSDSQIQLYSPFFQMREAIAEVFLSFAQYAPDDAGLLVKNHPLDNGLINYSEFIRSLANELGILDRVCFVEGGVASDMSKKSKGVVLVNSSVGLTALSSGCPVFCLGSSVYNVEGLTSSTDGRGLNEFWNSPLRPDEKLVSAFRKVLKNEALIPGNFYCPSPIRIACRHAVRRISHLVPLRAISRKKSAINRSCINVKGVSYGVR